jgi:hypothetical protein
VRKDFVEKVRIEVLLVKQKSTSHIGRRIDSGHQPNLPILRVDGLHPFDLTHAFHLRKRFVNMRNRDSRTVLDFAAPGAICLAFPNVL